MTTPFPANTAVYYLDANGDITKKVLGADAGHEVILLVDHLGHVSTMAEDAPPLQTADVVSRWDLYEDGSIAAYSYDNRTPGTDEYVHVEFAHAPEGQRQAFGPNGEYFSGPLTSYESVKDGVAEMRTFAGGQPTEVKVWRYVSETDPDFFELKGTLDPSGTVTVSLTNAAHPTGLVNVGPGSLVGLLPLNAGHLIGNDGSTLIGNDGSTLIGNDGSTLIGNDGSTFDATRVSSLISDNGAVLIGNDGSTLIGNDGSTLIGNDGSTLQVAQQATNFALNSLANMRGYRAYAGTSTWTEPADDFGESAAGAGTVEIGQTVAGALEQAGDSDWYAVTLEAGREYSFSMTGIDGGHNLLADPRLALVDSDGNPVLANGIPLVDDDGGLGRDARLVFTPEASGTYYIVAASTDEADRGAYELSVEASPTAAFVQSTAQMDISGGGAFVGAPVIAHLTAGDYAGGFVIAWTQMYGNQHSGFPFDVHVQVQIVTADGTIIDLDGRPEYTTYSPDHQGGYNDADDAHPSVAVFEDGSFVVTYTDTSYNYAAGESPKTRTTMLSFNADGSVDENGPMIPTQGPGMVRYDSSNADVVVLENGNWLTFVHRWGIDGPSGTEQAVSNIQVSLNGAAPDPAAHLGLTDLGASPDGAIAATAFGTGAVAVWTAGHGDLGSSDAPAGDPPSSWGVRGAVLSASGTVVASFAVNDAIDFAQYITNGSQVADLGEGRFVVAWNSQNIGRQSNAFFRIFSYGDGEVDAVTGDIKVSTLAENASIVALPSGGFAVVYGRDNQIRMQTYNESGGAIGNETIVAGGYNASAVATEDGLVAVTYMLPGGAIRLKYMEPNLAPTDIALSNDNIDENSAQGTFVGTLSATDGNGITDSLTYSIVDPDGWFYIDGNTLRFDDTADHQTRHLDYEDATSHAVTIRVTDSAGVSHDEQFVIAVNNVNEAPLDLEVDSAQIGEDAADGTVVATLAAIDTDGHGPFTYTLVDANGDPLTGVPFTIVDDELRINGTLDYEARPYYSFYVRISDGELTIDSSFDVYLQDIDDAKPTNINTFPGDLSALDEDAPAGTGIALLMAVDNDSDPTDITYEILNSDGTFRLEIDASGYAQLLTNGALDYETATSHDVTIRASDANGHYDKTFTIEVDDVNEAPVIVGGSVRKDITVPTGTSINTVLYAVSATDPEDDELSYDTSPAGRFDFWMDEDGNLRFSNAPAAATTYDFQVWVSDGAGHRTTQDVRVTVEAAEAVNTPPNILGNLNIAVSVNENATQVRMIEAVDADFDTLTWSIAGGPDADKFKIVPVSNSYVGLEFKVAPDFENPTDIGHNGTYNVIVMAMDSHGGYDTQSIAVSVLNVAEQPPDRPPTITSNGGGATAAITVKENIRAVTKVVATDPDAGSFVTYSLVSGSASPDKAKFVIDSKTGQLSFISPPDFETRADANKDNKYVVQVKASSGAASDIQTLTVSVGNDDGKARTGTKKAENLTGTSSEEKLTAKQGNDTIKALAGADTLNGGTGADKLYGGADEARDTFAFLKGDSGTTSKTWDQVFDFRSGIDKIDLSGIDGDPARGLQDLRFVTNFAKPGSKTDGQFRVVDAGKHVNIEIDYNGDKKADMIIRVLDVDKLVAADFIL